MKKVFHIACMLLLLGTAMTVFAAQETRVNTVMSGEGNVVFRATQKMVANDGTQIVLYTTGRFEQRDAKGYTILEGTYRLSNGELSLIPDDNRLAKLTGSYSMNNGINLSSINVGGKRFYYRK